MASRRERVILDLTDNFTPGMVRAAAAAALLSQSLDDVNSNARLSSRALGNNQRASTRFNTSATTLNRTLATTNRNVSDLSGMRGFGGLNEQIRRTDNTVGGSTRQLDRYSGRLHIIGQALAVLGPAAIPIGAVAVPAVAGLAAQLGFAAAAGGTAMLAFLGVGDALKTMNKAHLDPTTANLKAAQLAMANLSPAARDLVTQLRSLGDEGKALRDSAAEGLFPGVSKALDELQSRLPQVERILFHIGQATGDILARGAESLGSSRWNDFFTFLETDARSTLSDLASAVGHVGHAFATLLVQADPLSNDFSGWLVDVTARFDKFTQGLGQTQGFADFLAYLHTAGPQVGAALGAIATALLDIVEAASPLGGPVLAAIEGFAKAVSAIANSDFGTPIFAALAAMSLLSRGTALWGKVSGSASKTFIAGQARASMGVRTLTTDLAIMRAEYARVGAAQAVLLSGMSRTTAAAQRTAVTMKSLGKTAGLIGGLALATSGVADGMGLQNTASMALMGAMIGGAPGAAVGGLVGATMDVAHANDSLESAVHSADAALASMAGPAEMSKQLALLNTQITSTQETLSGGMGGMDALTHPFQAIGEDFQQSFTQINDLFTNTVAESAAAKVALEETKAGYTQLALLMGARVGTGPGAIDAIAQAAERAAPAMKALGITWREFQNASASQKMTFVAQIKNWNTAADSAGGRTKAFGKTVADLSNEMLSTADSASALSAALEGVLSPGMNLSQATDALRAGLRNMGAALDDSSRSLTANTDGADKNREAIRGQVTAIQAKLDAEAQAGASSGRLTRILAEQRLGLIHTGVALGLNGKELRTYLKQLGLTPKMVETAIKATNLSRTRAEVINLNASYKLLPKDLKTDIRTNGIPQSKSAIEELTKKYKLTPEQVKTLVELKDQAAIRGINNVASLLRALDGNTATTYIDTVHRTRSGPGGTSSGITSAAGGYIRGPGTSTSDSIPARLSDREYVVKAAAVDKYGVGFMDNVNAMRFASGGQASRAASSTAQWVAPSLAGLRIEGRIEVSERGSYLRGVIREEIGAEKRFDKVSGGR